MLLDLPLFRPLTLPNGTKLKNRLIKSAMSDMLGDGRGNPTVAQRSLYARWAAGGVAASIVGEVQGDPGFPEASGNLVLGPGSDTGAFQALAVAGQQNNHQLWLQLGHAGALTPAELGVAAGPSNLDFPELRAREMSGSEIRALPTQFAETAATAERLGFGGVQIHAAHGFLLSQFLSPLFNQRMDDYGGNAKNRRRLLLEVVAAVRDAVSPGFAVALKLNSSDGLQGGLTEPEALDVIAALEGFGIDLIDISGGTYFPGAASSSDRAGAGAYFLHFARAARPLTSTPLMITGGIKRRAEALAAIESGIVDAVGLARALILNPTLPNDWAEGDNDPDFPSFSATPPGGVTAWYSMAIRALAEGKQQKPAQDASEALAQLDAIKETQARLWRQTFPADA